MNRTIKLLIILFLCICLALVVVFNDAIWSLLLLFVYFIKGSIIKFLLILKKFFFKKGVVSFVTIAWERVFVSSFFALSKRAIINTISGFFQNRLVKPLIHPLSRYIRIRWKIFKESNFLKKFLTVLFGTVPASIGLWFIGIADVIALLMKSLSLSKFLTLILKFISMFFLFFQNIWRTWIQPYIDLILITIFITYIEKIPFVGGVFRRARITIRWELRHVRNRKKNIIENHIDRPVTLLSERINKHVDKKKEGLKSNMNSTSSSLSEQEGENKIQSDLLAKKDESTKDKR